MRYASDQAAPSEPHIRRHLFDCSYCRHRLKEFEEVKRLSPSSHPPPEWLLQAEDQLLEPILRDEGSDDAAPDFFQLAADTSADVAQSISFSTLDGETIVRCEAGKNRCWRLTLVQPPGAEIHPILLELNDHLYKAVIPNVPLDVPELRFRRDEIIQAALVRHDFAFRGNLEQLGKLIAAPYALQMGARATWKLDKDPNLSRSRGFFWLRSAGEEKFGPLPLAATSLLDLSLCLFDIERHRSVLEKLD
jgi:hypothetical protein